MHLQGWHSLVAGNARASSAVVPLTAFQPVATLQLMLSFKLLLMRSAILLPNPLSCLTAP